MTNRQPRAGGEEMSMETEHTFSVAFENGIRVSVRNDGRRYCNNCGIALDVGGGCGVCKPTKTIDIHGQRTEPRR